MRNDMDKWAIMLNLMQSTPQTQVNQFAPAEYSGSFQTPDLQDSVEAGKEAGRTFRNRRDRKKLEEEEEKKKIRKYLEFWEYVKPKNNPMDFMNYKPYGKIKVS